MITISSFLKVSLFFSFIVVLTYPVFASDESDLDLAIFEKYNIFYEPPTKKPKSTNKPKTPYFAINWLDKSNNEARFIIERRIKPNKTYTSKYYAPANSTSFYDDKIEPNKTYCYRVSASNSVGNSPSSEVCIDSK